MKKLFGTICILFASATSFASPSIQYDLSIQNSVYRLVVQEVLPASTSFSQVVANLRNPELFKAFSPSIKDLDRSNQTGSQYSLTMVVKKLGIASTSKFNCNESWGLHSWERVCHLLTDVAQGGKFMKYKVERSTCTFKAETQETQCILSYEGEMKDIKMLGMKIMPAEKFAVKAKYEAMKHFAQIWMYSLQDGSSIEQVRAKYPTTELSAKIDEVLANGTALATAAVKSGRDFDFHAAVKY